MLALRGITLTPAVRDGAGDLFRRLDREAMSGRALLAGDRFAAVLREAADLLARAADTGGAATLPALLAPLAERLDRMAGTAAVAELDVIPIEALAPETVEDHVVPIESLAPDPEADLVSIQSLLYTGRRALERADRVRRELDTVLRIRGDFAGAEPLIAELIDLVPLALAD